MDLELKLRRSTKKKTNRKHKKLLGKSIDDRPAVVDAREEMGHWEIDTVIGYRSKDDVLLTLTERKTRHEIVRKIRAKKAPEVTRALEQLLEESPKLQCAFKSITADNGSEFSELAEWGEEKGIDIYFAQPYSSWERGTNERHNGLIRRFIKQCHSSPI
ncbi:IS30 family transposase [Oceanobacillus oncorhynchi]|uniref:Integrase core domain protein n=1 Tax=Oceanobacillus oncorhynchi TaxID=545501 RepID=A0A0A1ML92_9BACI|nr:IS30 family transposase [Oceanobacillus oncorhynchi]MDM8099101.1 IS30 family transposase [Oceanobacillus oncorhynchi]CEI80462.1 Integrase core domain protein [Oceanobacillus oncorhynchi]